MPRRDEIGDLTDQRPRVLESLEKFEWYESKRVGLGAKFVHAVDAVLVALLDFPESCEVFHRNTRRRFMGRFPFEVFYRLEDGLLVVVACIHAARDPKLVLRRIGG